MNIPDKIATIHQICIDTINCPCNFLCRSCIGRLYSLRELSEAAIETLGGPHPNVDTYTIETKRFGLKEATAQVLEQQREAMRKRKK